MGVFRLTDVSNCDRETKEYWNARTKSEWGYPLHGLFGAGPGIEDRIAKMDRRNCEVITGLLTMISASEYVRVLECACGYGRYLPLIRGLCNSYTGIDLAERNIAEAERIYLHRDAGDEFVVADMATFQTRERYNLIFMVSAWSSIEQNSAEIITHLKTLLKAGGKIAIFEESLYMVIDQ